MHDRRLFLDGEPVGLVHDQHQRLVEREQVPDGPALGPREVAVTNEQHDMGALRFFQRHLVEPFFVPPGTGYVRQQDLVTRTVAPPEMTHVAGRTADDIDGDIGFRHERLDERTLSRTDLTEKTEMNNTGLLAGRQLLELLLRITDVDTG